MTTVSIVLEWFRCPKGYRIVRAAEIARASGENPKSYPDVDWIVPNTDERIGYRPLDNNDLLCIAFSRLRTPESLLEFINFHGPITRTSPQWGDSIPGCLRWASQFSDLLSCKEKGPKKLASVFNSQIRVSHARAYKRDVGLKLPVDYDFGEMNQMIGTADLIADPVRGVHLRNHDGCLNRSAMVATRAEALRRHKYSHVPTLQCSV